MYVRRLDEIEDFRFDVTHLPGSRNPSDPLSRRGFRSYPTATAPPCRRATPPRTASRGSSPGWVGTPLPTRRRRARRPDHSGSTRSRRHSSRSGAAQPRRAVPSMLATVRATWAATRQEAAAMFANNHEGGAIPSALAQWGWPGAYPPLVRVCSSRWQAQSCRWGPAPRRLHRHRSRRTTSFSRRRPSRPWWWSWRPTQFSGPSCAALRRHPASSSTGSASPSSGPLTHRRVGRSWCAAGCCTAAGMARPLPLHPRRRRAPRAGALRVPRRPARWALRASQDGVPGAAPRLLGGPGRRGRRVRALVPEAPAHQCPMSGMILNQ